MRSLFIFGIAALVAATAALYEPSELAGMRELLAELEEEMGLRRSARGTLAAALPYPRVGKKKVLAVGSLFPPPSPVTDQRGRLG